MESHPFESRATRHEPAVGGERAGRRGTAHTHMTPSVREMTPAETEAQRRLVRASLLVRPARPVAR